MSLRRRLHPFVDAEAWRRPGLSPFNLFICIMIGLAVLTGILETEKSLRDSYGRAFYYFEILFFIIFLVEYVLRVYVAPENNNRYGGRAGRLRYIFSPMAILDLLVLFLFVFSVFATQAFILRILRILRIIRLARLGRFSRAWNLLGEAFAKRRYELALSGCIAFLMLIISSAFLFYFESSYQPEEFGSIPRALWWSIATLTTVGYGDVTPITVLGRFFAGVTAVIGIGLVAMPTGILAAAFSDAFQRNEKENSSINAGDDGSL